MNVGLEDAILDTMDSALEGYLNSDEYQKQTDEIERLENDFKASLSPAQVKLFICLLDKINDSDGRVTSQAYVAGVLRGIAFRDKYMK